LCHLGEDVAEQLEYVRASFRVIRHVRPKLACAWQIIPSIASMTSFPGITHSNSLPQNK
jgi:hypothetical protein